MCQLGELPKDSAALPVNHPKKLVSVHGVTSGSIPVERQCPLTGHGLSSSNSWWLVLVDSLLLSACSRGLKGCGGSP